jgi:hypothetical protein
MKAAILALALCTGSALAAPPSDPGYSFAVQEYRAGHWSSAYGQFMTLANNGSIESARIALFMYRHGKELYASDWAASEDELELWSRMTGTRGPNEPDRVASAATKPPTWKARMYRFVGRGDK